MVPKQELKIAFDMHMYAVASKQAAGTVMAFKGNQCFDCVIEKLNI